MKGIILSLFDYSGTWSAPYRAAGYCVLQIELKHGCDILTWDYTRIPKERVVGVLAAIPCTDYALSGARWWAEKDRTGQTEASNALTRRTLEIIRYFNPKFWVAENPVGRIEKCVPELRGKLLMRFNPSDFGHPYTKKTCLWGHFNPLLVRQPVKPTEGSVMWKKYGGKSERTKTARSVTPPGFANAFFQANQP